ncbi:hypothetical protein BEN71_17495 [Acinetobacter wuhouensis]|uniref:DUF4870 domain-containing protein n=1 Tax=Acinetobacter wuhouensis TaxID=1879050 RepID=A0A385C7P8_9GAMM|nr:MULTISPECIES: hypothetical protein [Acinetobacter]AXQ23751.1 hypothetical protein BEN71_17495 [Acinetobacter wuhouensis]AYO52962.1 hypothetical protein CDG68_04440 [Acinetobacter wuhouensis]RZG47250.1 hypothetical protein EXU28_06680 [Acinetobacter wuhouensis]RZG73238.1 hypothetical protein EXU29_07855 [Acinetobacter wuhouensis]RZG78207.1 hypothetical protein EXE09_01190 [Acinetobacter sp. WCHAc060025]
MNNYSNSNNSKSLTLILYILYIVAIFSAGILAVIALIINYVKLDSVRGTIFESHFKWQIRTFWWYLIWTVLAFVPYLFLFFTLDNPNAFAGVAFAATIFCVAVLFISWIWIVYRAIRGIIALNDDQALPI